MHAVEQGAGVPTTAILLGRCHAFVIKGIHLFPPCLAQIHEVSKGRHQSVVQPGAVGSPRVRVRGSEIESPGPLSAAYLLFKMPGPLGISSTVGSGGLACLPGLAPGSPWFY